MLRRLRFSAVATMVLAVAFLAFFQVAKQVPSIAAINPTANDPYDAIGSFAIQAAMLLAVMSLVRAFWPGRAEPTNEQAASMARMQIAVVAAVEVTLIGDVVALVRHTDVWMGSALGVGYAVALAILDAYNAWVGWQAATAMGSGIGVADQGQRLRFAASVIALIAVLGLYPEGIRASVPGALATVVVGAVLLFVPMAEVSLVLVPYSADRSTEALALPRWLQSSAVQWAGLAVGALFAGACLVFAEGGGGFGLPPHVVGVYLGLEATGAVIGFALMRGPLGFKRS